MRYSVIVGNLGTVHSCNNVRDARFCARKYVDKNKTGYGHTAGETVTVFDNSENEIVDRYIGENDSD